MELRDYQVKCKNSILTAIKDGTRRVLIVLATGTGKTVIFSSIVPLVKANSKKTLILAHREELLTQAKEKIELTDPSLKVEIEQAEKTSEPDADVVVASVPTLGRAGSERIKKFNPEHFGLIVIDEAHHSVASTYMNILKYFGCVEEDGSRPVGKKHPVVLGVTATPSRKDNVGLENIFDELVFKYDIKDGIDNGWLADIRAYTIFTHENMDVSVRAGDFAVGELSEAVNTPQRNNLVVQTYKRLSEGEKALCFAVDIEHAQMLTQTFLDDGIQAECVTGETSKEDREQILKDFQHGDLEVVVNCMVLTEGYDNPNIKNILFARPTTSQSLYIQMAGRGTRLAEGKDHVKFIDFVDNMAKHDIVSSSSLIGQSKPIKADGHAIMALKSKFDDVLASDPLLDISTIDIDNIDDYITEVDIFAMAQLPAIVQNTSKNAWHKYLDGFKMSLGTNEDDGSSEYIEIREAAIGYQIEHYTVQKVEPSFRTGWRKNIRTSVYVTTAHDSVSAIEKADVYIFQNMNHKRNLINQDAKWRKDPPSEKQVKLLVKFGYKQEDVEQLTKGEASNLLSQAFARSSKSRL